MRLFKKHLLSKSFGISLCILCWTVTIYQYCHSLYVPGTKTINAFIENPGGSCIGSYPDFYLKDINKTTKELVLLQKISNQPHALNIINSALESYDKNIILVSCNNAGSYYDYYFYSPELDKSGTSPLAQGSNIHVAVTSFPVHIYIGIPYIDYDF